MVVFGFLDDKEKFKTYYKRELAKRLIFGQLSGKFSLTNEAMVLSKLMLKCGKDFTHGR
jgi:hypothetical protein